MCPDATRPKVVTAETAAACPRRAPCVISASEYPPAPFGSNWGLFGAVLQYWLPRQLSVDAHRLVLRAVSFGDLRGALQAGSGYVCQHAARVNASHQLLAAALRIPASSDVAAYRVVVTLAGAWDQAFKMLREGADARPYPSYTPGRRSWPLNTVLGDLVLATVIGVLANETA